MESDLRSQVQAWSDVQCHSHYESHSYANARQAQFIFPALADPSSAFKLALWSIESIPQRIVDTCWSLSYVRLATRYHRLGRRLYHGSSLPRFMRLHF